jgi:hypothetical protein
MGERLLKYYQFISMEKGLQGKVELAKETKVPSANAAMEPDSPDKIKLFQEAVRKITGKPAPMF